MTVTDSVAELEAAVGRAAVMVICAVLPTPMPNVLPRENVKVAEVAPAPMSMDAGGSATVAFEEVRETGVKAVAAAARVSVPVIVPV